MAEGFRNASPAQSTSVIIGLLVTGAGFALWLLPAGSIDLGEVDGSRLPSIDCKSVVGAWLEEPSQGLGRERCDNNRSDRLLLGSLIAGVGIAIGWGGWVMNSNGPRGGSTHSPSETATPSQSDPSATPGPDERKTAPPKDQRPPPGWWWDGNKWNPPAD